MVKPTIPARRNTARNAKTVARTHTMVWSRRMGMPSDAARSARSAPARIAMPVSLRRRNQANPTSTIGTATTATTSVPRNTIGSIVKCTSNGAGIELPVTLNQRGSSSAAAASTCAIPIVATERTRRGEREKRRTRKNSTAAPTTSAAASPATRASHQFSATVLIMSSTANVAGSVPRSPAAKLMIRFARQTRARPNASSDVSAPTSAPCTSTPAGTDHPAAANTRTPSPIAAGAKRRTARRAPTLRGGAGCSGRGGAAVTPPGAPRR